MLHCSNCPFLLLLWLLAGYCLAWLHLLLLLLLLWRWLFPQQLYRRLRFVGNQGEAVTSTQHSMLACGCVPKFAAAQVYASSQRC
jgi:hypothetical protein